MEQPIAAAEPAAAAPEASSVGFWVRGGAMCIDSVGLLAVGIALALAGVPRAAAFGILAQIAYNAAMVAACGQTLGKMAAGAKVVMVDGSRVDWGHAVGRALVQYVSGMLVGLGYVLAAFTPQKRALHDYAAGTRVVYLDGVGGGRKGVMVALACFMFAAPIGFFAFLGIYAAKNPKLLSALRSANGGEAGEGEKFAELIIKSREGATKGNLGALRSAVTISFADHEGVYPAALEEILKPSKDGKPLLEEIPAADTADHGKTQGWERYGAEACAPTQGPSADQLAPSALRDTGKWGYVADPKAPCAGTVFVDCTHVDTKGKTWYGY